MASIQEPQSLSWSINFDPFAFIEKISKERMTIHHNIIWRTIRTT